MLAIKKPRNARSKRALDKRQPQLNEGVKTALIVNASHSSALVSKAIHQLSTLKKPHAIPFTKKKSNDVNPFVDSGSIEFWSAKNDTPLMLVGDSRKKRKDNLTWIRLFDGRVLDMLEMGIDSMKGVEEFKPPTLPDIGSRPLFHFGGPQFSADAASLYPAHAHLKSLLLDFYRGEEVLENGIPTGGSVALQNGLQFVVSIVAGSVDEQIGPLGSSSAAQGTSLADLYAAGAAASTSGVGSSSSPSVDTSALGAKIYFRTYSLVVPPKTPARAIPSQFELHECGPAFDFTLRRRQAADPTLLSHSLKRGKTQAEKNRQGKSDTYKKNIDTDEMGDMVGRIHVGKQDLTNLQTRKMKGLKAAQDGEEGDSDDDDDDGAEVLSDGEEEDEEDAYMGLGGDEDSDVYDDEQDEELDMAGLTQGSASEDDGDGDDEPMEAAPKGVSKDQKRARKA